METKIIHLMGTVIQLQIAHETPKPILEEAERRLRIYEKRFSANDANSELMAVNKNAGIQAVQVHPELYELIKIGQLHSVAPNSRMNIAIGPLVQTWRIGFADAKVPTDEEVQQKLSQTNPQAIICDDAQSTVFLAKADMAIDLGALAKGYFADLLRTYFEEVGVQSALINLGGNLVVYGPCPNRTSGMWKIGIQDPLKERNHYLLSLNVQNRSIVTSGIYERQLVHKGKTYHHILNPQTGYPAETDVVSLTIVSKHSLDGEIWTTRLFGQNANEILLQLNQLAEIDGIIVTSQQILFSEGIKKYL
ncbi:FAD:protein FMN transferase [Candidatus Enterococcus willemsii]|uniref:FAD:protein FMN transferase n=1 Tax=Candidatus Enterococcus willemsii TaxID=1857215 RepID=A0ABQ6YWB8_9ENTE|nr:FAD:protein FMN transferase [Enterococcus sp. CU12B]KAF1301046.1 thiamine biosynthesis protein ApbE [Enterococcus sp. CU12B]